MNDSTHRARTLRQNQTAAETLLWGALRAKRLSGIKFRRQFPIDPFIADFACVAKQLIVEVDGGYHEFRDQEDEQRTGYMEQRGWCVIRFSNESINADLRAVVVEIARTLGVELTIEKTPLGRSGMKVVKKKDG